MILSRFRLALRHAAWGLSLILLLGMAPPALAARLALVVGNNAYPGNELRSAVNDARDVAAALKQAGFDILLRENVTRDALFQAIQEFGARLKDGDSAVFYFAGHAIQVRDRNYLIPVDAKVRQEDDVSFYSLDVAEILLRMDRARTRANILILDACRDNPFASTVRFSSVGLAQMSAPPGTLIAYATAPGQVAREGSGRNGVYTRQLLRHMPRPNQPIELMLKRVRESVLEDTNGQQVPWDSSSLRGHFAFVVDAQAAEQAAAGSASIDVRMNTERTFWESIKESRDPKEFDAYIQQFPDGIFVLLARSRIEQLQARAAAAVAPAPTVTAAPTVAAAPPIPVAPAPAPAVMAAVTPTPPAAVTPVQAASSARPVESRPPVAAVILPAAPIPSVAPIVAGAPKLAANLNPGTTVALAGMTGRSVGGAASSSSSPSPAPDTSPSGGAPASPTTSVQTLSDGSQFQGALVAGQPHGRGHLASTSSGDYKGDFVNGVREGQGEQRWPNGDVYTGGFKADQPSGRGVMQFANGDRYEGGFLAGLFSGEGKLVTRAGYEYEGQFVSGRRQGKGKARFPDGNRYTGDFENDSPDGRGVMEFADGARYEGAFRDGLPSGSGVYRFADGARYEGAFQAGLMSGLGVFHYKNGDRLEGQFEKGVANGAGVHFFARGGRFEGMFSNQGRSAVGVSVDARGNRTPTRLENGEFKPVGG